MKIGIIYYSRTGNTEIVAKKIEEEIRKKKANVETIKIEHVKRPSFFQSCLCGNKTKRFAYS